MDKVLSSRTGADVPQERDEKADRTPPADDVAGGLAARFIAACAALPPEAQQRVAGMLTRSGLFPMAPSAPVASAMARLHARLQLSDAQQLHLEPMLDLLEMLFDFASAIDVPVSIAWKEISGGATRGTPLAKNLSRFMTGEPGATRDGVAADLQRLKQLVAAFMAAIPETGKLAHQHFSRIAPSEIAAMVKLEKAHSLVTSKEKACWRKFEQLADEIKEEAIDSEIRRALTGYVNKLVKAAQPAKTAAGSATAR